MQREGEREREVTVGELQNTILNFIDGTQDSEINQIQSHNSDYRVRNLIYLRVIVVPFILRYGIPPDAVNWRRGGTFAYRNELGRP